MPDSTKDRSGDIAPPLVNGFNASIAVGGTGTGTGDGSASSLKRTNIGQLQSHSRLEPPPLSITLPSRGNSYGNGVTSFPSGPLSAGYLEQRRDRDTFHALSHTSSTSTSYQYLSNTNAYNNATFLQDDHQPPLSLHHRPQSLSYANLQYPSFQSQHHTSLTSMGSDNAMRRRRLSTASSSSKQRHGSSSNLRPKVHNTPHHTRRFTTLISDQEPDTTYLWGYLLFFFTMFGFTGSMYALVASNYMPMTGNKVGHANPSSQFLSSIPFHANGELILTFSIINMALLDSGLDQTR
ncbi:hypothetical protein BGX31_011689 [Mortierella sp. GBA43]|nr:hypothetical protein BGX31_011689 [Mortierella sp. GBA43]